MQWSCVWSVGVRGLVPQSFIPLPAPPPPIYLHQRGYSHRPCHHRPAQLLNFDFPAPSSAAAFVLATDAAHPTDAAHATGRRPHTPPHACPPPMHELGPGAEEKAGRMMHYARRLLVPFVDHAHPAPHTHAVPAALAPSSTDHCVSRAHAPQRSQDGCAVFPTCRVPTWVFRNGKLYHFDSRHVHFRHHGVYMLYLPLYSSRRSTIIVYTVKRDIYRLTTANQRPVVYDVY